MTNSYNPIALKPIDYATPLQNVYAEQSAALDRYQAQLRERDRQKEAATLNLPEIFSKLASFSQSIASATAAHKKGKQDKLLENRLKTKLRRRKAGVDDEILDEHYTHINETEELKKDLTKLKIYLKTQEEKGNIGPKERDYIIANHGATLLNEMEFIGHKFTKEVIPQFNSFTSSNTEEGKQAQLRWDSNAKDPAAQRAQLEEFALNGYKKLGLKDEFIIENYWPEIERTLDTKNILNTVKYDKTRNTERSLEIDGEIDVAIGKLNNNNPSALTFQVSEHIKEGVSKGITIEKSKENYTNRLYRLGKTGKLQQHELDLIRTGLLKDHPAGTTGEVLLKPEQWKQIQQGINEYANATVTQAKAIEVSAATNDMAAIINNPENLTVEQLQQVKENRLLRLSRTVGKDDPAYKDLDDLDVSAQVEGSYEATKEEYKGYYNGSDLGKLLQNKESFKSIPNKRVSQELLGKVKEAEEYLASIGLPTTWDKLLTVSKDEILTSPAQQQNLKRDKVFSEETKRIQTELAQKKLQINLYMKDKYPDPTEASAQADKAYKEWKDSEGFNVKDIPGNEEIVGRLSPNIEGEYVRAGFLREARVENNAKPSTYQIGHWSARTQNAIIKANGNIEDMLNKPESLIDKEDALGAFIEPSQTGEFQLFYSPELVTKSLAIGKQPGYVLKKTVEALITDPTYKDYVKKFQLKEKLKILENAPDLRLKEIIDKLGDKDLITQYNYRGIMSFTPKQLTRLMNLEIASNVPIVEK